jgi:hypothetical protein
MASRSLSCPRCGGSMEQGYILDESYGKIGPQKWVGGAPEFSIWTGLKLRGKQRLPVTAYRCRQCGFLESYADS